MSKNVIKDKTYNFALGIIKLYKKSSNSNLLLNQLLKSGTSIGANVAEAINAQTKKDFLSKMWISYKEANETKYWLELFRDSDIGNNGDIQNLLVEVNEIIKILSSITKTTKESLK